MLPDLVSTGPCVSRILSLVSSATAHLWAVRAILGGPVGSFATFLAARRELPFASSVVFGARPATRNTKWRS
jgi:hypothetical protein